MSKHVKLIYGKASPTVGLPNLVCFKAFREWIGNSGLQNLYLKRKTIPRENGQMTQVQVLEK